MTAPGTPGSGRRIGSERRWLMDRVGRLVAAVRGDPSFRRGLRSEPPAAFARLGLDGSLAPASLTIDPAKLDILINAAQLFGLVFGLAGGAPTREPPLELRLIAYGAKPAGLLHGSEADLAGHLDWARRRGMTALLGPHEWDQRSDDGKGGYSNITGAQRPARAGSSAMRVAVVAADEDRAILAWAALAFHWDEFLGALLGYPSCCVAAFAARWPEACERQQGDLAVPTLLASGAPPYDWRVNNFGRYFGAEIIQHFPCRFDCTATLAQAVRVARILESFEPDRVAGLKTVLAAPVVYTETDGVAVLPGAAVCKAGGENGAMTIDYDADLALLTEPTGALARALRRATRVAVDDDGKLTVDDHRLDGHVAWFANADLQDPSANNGKMEG